MRTENSRVCHHDRLIHGSNLGPFGLTTPQRRRRIIAEAEGMLPALLGRWCGMEVTYRTLPARGRLHLIPKGKHHED